MNYNNGDIFWKKFNLSTFTNSNNDLLELKEKRFQDYHQNQVEAYRALKVYWLYYPFPENDEYEAFVSHPKHP